MTKSVDEQVQELAELRLPDLQARFAEIVGEPTRSPNKRYLLLLPLELADGELLGLCDGESRVIRAG